MVEQVIGARTTDHKISRVDPLGDDFLPGQTRSGDGTPTSLFQVPVYMAGVHALVGLIL